MTTRPAPRLPARHLDKVVHFFAYAVLAMSMQFSLRKSRYTRSVEPLQSGLVASPNSATSGENPRRESGACCDRGVMLAVVLAMAIGALDETLQIFSPFRTASFLDFLADAAGAVAGSMLMSFIYRRRIERRVF